MRDIMMFFCFLESDNYLVIHSKEWMIHRCVCALAHDVIVRLPFGGTGRPDWSTRKEHTFINQDIPSKAASLSSANGHVPLAKPGEKVHFFFHKIACPCRPVLNFCERPMFLETLRLRCFGISCEPRTSRSHVTRALPCDMRFEVHVCTARPRSRGETSQSHVWEEIRLFRTLSLIDYRIQFQKNLILKTISQLK